MERPKELSKLENIFADLKELSNSDVPVIKDNVILMLGTMRDLLSQVYPDKYYEFITQFE